MQLLPARVRWSRLVRVAAGGALIMGFLATGAQAQNERVASDEPAAFLVFPKIIVDTSDVFGTGVARDTVIQLTNTDPDEASGVNCWLIDATPRCSNTNNPCRTTADCPLGGVCAPSCGPGIDIQLVLTPDQPIAWRASTGLTFLPCSPNNPDPQSCIGEAFGNIPGVGSFFQGELKCVQVAAALDDDTPVDENDLKGEATIYRVGTGEIGPNVADTASYNAIGIQALPGVNDGDNILCLGPPLPGATLCTVQEYAGCPGVLILDHFFDGVASPINTDNSVSTELTLASCTEDLSGALSAQVTTTAQMLVYNEFEQRFSTSRRVQCVENLLLSDIDTRAGDADNQFSLFSAGVQGTVTGQTRIRGVQTAEPDLGHGLLGVAQEFHVSGVNGGISPSGSAAFNLHYTAERAQGDVVELTLPLPLPPP